MEYKTETQKRKFKITDDNNFNETVFNDDVVGIIRALLYRGHSTKISIERVE